MRAATPSDSPRPRRRRALLAVSALMLAPLGPAGAVPDLTWIDGQALATGEVLVHTSRSARPQTVRIEVATTVDAPPEAIFDVLRTCELAPEYVPNIVSCRSLEVVDDGRSELFIQVVKPAFFTPSFEHVFRLDYVRYERVDVHRVSGPIAYMEGSWWLLPRDDGTILLVYELDVDPGLPIPRFFVRATLRRDLPRLVRAVRERAEAQR